MTRADALEWGGASWIGIRDDVELRVDTPDDSGEIKPTGDAGRTITPVNRWYAYRREWNIVRPVRELHLTIAADSKYWLWINDDVVVYEGGAKRGPDPDSTYVDVIVLRCSLEPGPAQVRVLVWHFGKQGFSHHNSGRAGLLLRASAGYDHLESDGQWEVAVYPAFSTSPLLVPNYRLPESSLRYDAASVSTPWMDGPSGDLDWRRADELASPGAEPFGPLAVRPTPQWYVSGPSVFQQPPALPWISDGTTLRLSFPHNGHFHPRFCVSAKARDTGGIVDIRTDNYLGGGPAGIGAEYVLTEGTQEYECPGWMNGHELVLTIPSGVVLQEVGFRETRYDSAVVGAFESDDERVNTLWQKACRTLQVCMRDTFVDCPDRERAQWWGDEVIQLHQCFYALDPRSHALIRKGILELANWHREDDSLFSPVPSGNWDRELPMQMLLSVGHGFLTYYMHTGDLETVAAALPAVLRYIDLWEQDERGRVVARPGDWTWGDWGPNKDMDLLYQGHFALALRSLIKLCEYAGRPDDAMRLRRRYQRLAYHFDENFWDGTDEGYRGRNHDGPIDDRGQALAVVASLVPAHRRDPVAARLVSQQYASPYGEYMVDRALRLLGRESEALDRMRSRFSRMIDSSHTTLWEGWDVGSRQYGGGTVNHAWSGGPLVSLSAWVAGVEPLEPGYGRISVSPQLGDLARVAAELESVRGHITVSIDAGTRTIVLSTPVPATIRSPAGWEPADVTISGDSSSEELPPITRTGGQTESAATEVDVEPGTWTIAYARSSGSM